MKKILLIALILLFASAGCALGGDSAPWDFNTGSAASHRGREEAGNLSGNRGSFIVKSLRPVMRAVSAVDGDRCPMSPTCSAYALQAIDKHGLFIGSIMTVDRLIHELNEQDLAPEVEAGGRYRTYDPVAANDFWWFSGKSLDK